MNYFDALKIYNEGKPAWCSPRRGTFEYKAVIAIMKGTSVSSVKADSNAGSMSMSPAPVKPKRKYTRKPKAPAVDSGSAPAPKRRGRPPKICYDKDGNVIAKAPRRARVNRTPAVSSKKSSAPSLVSNALFGGVSSRSLPMTATSGMNSQSAQSMMGSSTMSMARNISLPKSSTPPAPPKRRAGNPVGRPRKQAGAPKGKYVRKAKAPVASNVSANMTGGGGRSSKKSPNTLFTRLMRSSTARTKSGQFV
jgi:hypothetical protein